MKDIVVTIIIPVFNVEIYIKECVKTVLSVISSSFEILLIDDGSTDQSGHICDDLAATDSRIRKVHQRNGGLSMARNTGICNAKGKYIVFLDADDYYVNDGVEYLIKKMDAANLDVCLANKIEQFDDKGKSSIKLLQTIPLNSCFSGETALLRGVTIASVCVNVYRRSFLEDNNLFFTKGISHEDVDFNTRAYICAKALMVLDTCFYAYRWNPTSLNRSPDLQKIEFKYISDFIVALNTKKYAKNTSTHLKKYLEQRANSIAFSTFIQLLREKNNICFKKNIIDKAKKMGALPIKGRTLSWKTTLLSHVLNCILCFL